jgi:hypothetical protein
MKIFYGAGLPRILDLSDNSSLSQKILFTVEEWDNIVNYFKGRYNMETVTIDELVLDISKIVISVSIIGILKNYLNINQFHIF